MSDLKFNVGDEVEVRLRGKITCVDEKDAEQPYEISVLDESKAYLWPIIDSIHAIAALPQPDKPLVVGDEVCWVNEDADEERGKLVAIASKPWVRGIIDACVEKPSGILDTVNLHDLYRPTPPAEPLATLKPRPAVGPDINSVMILRDFWLGDFKVDAASAKAAEINAAAEAWLERRMKARE